MTELKQYQKVSKELSEFAENCLEESFAGKFHDSAIHQDQVKQNINHQLANLPLGNADYSRMIADLRILRDLEANVEIFKKDNLIVRDARQYEGPFRTKHLYQIQFLNMVRAANIWLEEQKIGDPKLKAKLGLMAQNFYCDSRLDLDEKTQQNLINNYSKILIKGLSKETNIDEEQLSKQIQLTMNYANFEDTHLHTATISEIDGKIILQKNVALIGESEIHSDHYKALNDAKKNGASFEQVRADKSMPKFFKELSEFEQKMVYKYTKQLFEGNHVITNQLRHIPGLRNAYNYSVSTKENEFSVSTKENEFSVSTLKKNEFEEALSAIRIANPYSESKDETITENNIRELQEKVGGTIHLNSLVSPVPGPQRLFDIDKAAYEAGKKASASISSSSETNQVLFSNIPLNIGRFVVGNDYSGINQLIGKAIENPLYNIDENVKTFLSKPPYFSSKFNKEFNELTKTLDKDSLSLSLIKLKKAINRPNGFFYRIFDFGNHSKIHHNLDEVNILISEVVSKLQGYINVEFCKSGIDRTGLAVAKNSAHSLEGKVNATHAEILIALASTGDIQSIPGGPGGRLGADGIKKDTAKVLTKSDDIAKKLMGLDSANFNKDKRKKAKPMDGLFDWETGEISTIKVTKEAKKIKALDSDINIPPHETFTKRQSEIARETSPLEESVKTIKNSSPRVVHTESKIEVSKKVAELVNQHPDNTSREIVRRLVEDVIPKSSILPANGEYKEIDKTTLEYGTSDIGFISIKIDKEGKCSFETKPSENGKKINCIVIIPTKTGGYDLVEFKEGNLVNRVSSDKAGSILDKDDLTNKLRETLKQLVDKSNMKLNSKSNLNSDNEVKIPTKTPLLPPVQQDVSSKTH